MEWEDSASTSHAKNTVIEPSHRYNNEVTSATSEPPEAQISRIITFAYEDSYGNTRVLDITDFAFCQNPQREFLLAIRNKIVLYDTIQPHHVFYCKIR
jgi:hypothetical protein